MKKLFGNRDKDLDFKDIDIFDLEEDEAGYEDQGDDQAEIYYAEGYDEADASYEGHEYKAYDGVDELIARHSALPFCIVVEQAERTDARATKQTARKKAYCNF